MQIKIKNAVLHVLDVNATLPVFSQYELDLSETQIINFIETHIKRIMEDSSAKYGEFKNESIIPEILNKLDDSFLDSSVEISNTLYKIMKKYPNIPSADLLIAIVNIDCINYLSIIKFNYKVGYTHFVDYANNGTNNKIIVHKVIFPSESQKVEEGTLININDHSCIVVEKKFMVDGEKINYFSDLFLICKTNLSKKESINIINSVAKEVARKYYNDEYEKTALVKTAIYDSLEGEGNIKIEKIADSVFSGDDHVKKEYIEKVQEAGVFNEIIFSGNTPEKSFSKYKIKTDSGIELSIPMELYKNKNVIEFINSPDGTVSIVIKQINKIDNK